MKNVLILDDDINVLEMLREVLRYSDYSVNTSQSTAGLFHLIKQSPPDLILLDYMLNGINGGEVCRQIKSDPSTEKLPVIMISAYSNLVDFSAQYGCDDIILKPFDIDELLTKVEGCINKKSADCYEN